MTDRIGVNPKVLFDALDALESMWWQFGYECCNGEGRHSGGLSALEEAEDILIKHERIKKYRKNGKMEWYKPA